MRAKITNVCGNQQIVISINICVLMLQDYFTEFTLSYFLKIFVFPNVINCIKQYGYILVEPIIICKKLCMQLNVEQAKFKNKTSNLNF